MNMSAALAALNLSPAQLDGVSALLSGLEKQTQRDALHIQATAYAGG